MKSDIEKHLKMGRGALLTVRALEMLIHRLASVSKSRLISKNVIAYISYAQPCLNYQNIIKPLAQV